MISVKENHTALFNLPVTIQAIKDLDVLIAHFSEDKVGPAYVSFKYVSSVDSTQIDRNIMLTALKAQRQRLVEYLATLGIEWDL
jgi:EAL domain-containing protein (putative c-di-GMP-specific phosphodiesterase class I)